MEGMKMKNVKNVMELIENEVVTNNQLESEMLKILLNNIDGMNLEEAKHYMLNDAICVHGGVSGLIYYSETDEIFKKYYDEIFDLLNEYIYENGQICFELSANNLVWFSFEELVNKWSCEINWDELESELEE